MMISIITDQQEPSRFCWDVELVTWKKEKHDKLFTVPTFSSFEEAFLSRTIKSKDNHNMVKIIKNPQQTILGLLMRNKFKIQQTI